MARTIDHKYATSDVEHLLNQLLDENASPPLYAVTMYELGKVFGTILAQKLGSSATKVALVSTVEDADYLGKGILEILERSFREVYLTVFWNKRFKPNEENSIAIAPIIREFHDPGYQQATTLIVLKSIISSACVVKTNLTRLIEESNPNEIFVVAPVLLSGAIDKLKREFSNTISDKFQYIYFAEDTEKNREGYVLPGIGGNVYQRLGFDDQADKNRYTPAIVKQRRSKVAG